MKTKRKQHENPFPEQRWRVGGDGTDSGRVVIAHDYVRRACAEGCEHDLVEIEFNSGRRALYSPYALFPATVEEWNRQIVADADAWDADHPDDPTDRSGWPAGWEERYASP